MSRMTLGASMLVGPFALFALFTGASAQDAKSEGKSLFEEKCGGCHLDGGFGTRVLERRVPEGQARLDRREALPSAFTIAVVRRGIGSMPQIREAELSDEQLTRIAAYLEETK